MLVTVWLGTCLDFGSGPQGLLLAVSRGVHQMWHYNSFAQPP